MAKNSNFKPFLRGIKNQISALNNYAQTITPNGLRAMKDMARLDKVTGFGNLGAEGIQAMAKIKALLDSLAPGGETLLKSLQQAKTVDTVKDALTTA
jgi:hypothetical protein